MQRLQFVLFQIDEAKRYLVDGPLPGLRVALMLLDNAAEVLLDRWIEQDLEHDAMAEQVLRRAHEAGIPETHPHLSGLYKHRFLTAKEKSQVARQFDDKIHYVTEFKPMIASSTGAVLSHLHRYRNQAHHSGRVRAETIHTSGMILLELCCQLIESLKPMSAGYSSSEDFSWLESRFKLKPDALWNERTMAGVLAAFRHDMPIGNAGLRDTLAKNLEGRLEVLVEGLDFISTEVRVAADHGAALAAAQKFTLAEIKKTAPYRSIPRKLDKPVSMGQVETLESVATRIRNSVDSLSGFEIYADADSELERIEFMVECLGGAIDAQIQLAIDRARGK